ncbi:MAG: hypothetical protein EOO27_36525 [Comamonadaceae bacterium]|nr:MAG: hypothetical protein EOO27_36525 [Comamonadaceae bacterium]
MKIFNFLGGIPLLLPAVVEARGKTADRWAWCPWNGYQTVRFVEPYEALRVHTHGKAYPGRAASSATGRWVVLGDIIQTSGELADSLALPTSNPNAKTAFTGQGFAVIPINAILNIGVIAPMFGGRGGGVQGEYVGGPRLTFKQLPDNDWGNISGNV